QLPPNVSASMDFCKRALDVEGLALVPGIAFGDDRCVRFSCAVSSEIIEDGLERFQRVLKTF
ncbi:MAG: aspartate transaminase, partial [Synechococcus sp.]